MALASVAAAIPLGCLAGVSAASQIDARHLQTLTALGGVGAVAALVALLAMLRPLSEMGRRLRACAWDDAAEAAGLSDHPTQMMADLAIVTGKLEGLRHRLSNRHSVTQLPTREPFLNRIAGKLGAAGALGVVRFGDYDRLAAFDQVGADRALKAFAKRLTGAVSGERPLAQVDRDCFAIWFADPADPRRAAEELQAIGYVLGQELVDGDIKLSPEVGLGAALYPHDGADPASLLTRAFAALPAPGHPPDAGVAFFSAEQSQSARERFVLEQDLRQAIGRGELLLHYQPVIDLAAGRVIGAEALVRWNHPERGMVPPGRFVPVLEACGLMEEVGLWVLNSACREARRWRDDGLEGLTVAVNLSAQQLRDPELNTVIVRTLARHGLPAEALELELTETATMADADRTRQLFGELRALGVGVAIDDFGTGYSSLNYLKNLPFSKLKIDREFVTHVHERGDSHAICKALVELARGLGISVLAEGVETRAEADALRRMGCTIFQGFYFSRPLPAEAFRAEVADADWLAELVSPVHRERATLRSRL